MTEASSIETNEFLDSVPNTCIEKPFDIGARRAHQEASVAGSGAARLLLDRT
jgi:hypothetical protein